VQQLQRVQLHEVRFQLVNIRCETIGRSLTAIHDSDYYNNLTFLTTSIEIFLDKKTRGERHLPNLEEIIPLPLISGIPRALLNIKLSNFYTCYVCLLGEFAR
jgi:hypothetical protein